MTPVHKQLTRYIEDAYAKDMPLTREQKIWATKVARYGPTGRSIQPKRRPILERFFDRVFFEPNTGCWLFDGSQSPDGYAYFYVADRKMKVAHKFLYEREVEPVPDGMELDHLCLVRCCVNPQHLEVVTHAENVRRAQVRNYNRNKTHCRRGHPYSGYNLTVTSNGERSCKTCRRDDMRRSRAKKKGAEKWSA